MISAKSLLCQAIVASSVSVLFYSCDVIGQNRVKGNGHVIKEERQVVPFQRIKVEGSMNVYLTQGAAKAAVIEAEDNIAPLVELVEEDGRLIVRLKRGVSISTHKDLNVFLTTPEINEASLAGSGDLKLDGKFTSRSDVKFNLSGSGNLKGEINAPAVKASIAGSGDMFLKGETKDVNLSIAGSGNFEADELLSENVSVNIAGSGDADVYASVKLDAKIAGSGNVNYKGTPQISSSVAGSGSISKK
ncbi:head GIN domain-containing protein [Chitinophaga sp. ARDCPP14]|uniref:head GIN domain-containing protein n=1 Tax=Chitinophaga sp. ARDCPP14 TaxID=3391139 RepID=UPI003F51CAB7